MGQSNNTTNAVGAATHRSRTQMHALSMLLVTDWRIHIEGVINGVTRNARTVTIDASVGKHP